MKDGLSARRFLVRGRVQGVGFRWWTRRTALEIGVGGWVRNRPDGAVEVLAQGGENRIARFRELLWQGPGAARVDAIEESEAEVTSARPEGSEFRIVP